MLHRRAQNVQADLMLGDGADAAAVCRELRVSEQTYYRWRNQYGDLKANYARRLKELEKQKPILKRLLAEVELGRPCSRSWLRETSRPGQASLRHRAPDAHADGQ